MLCCSVVGCFNNALKLSKWKKLICSKPNCVNNTGNWYCPPPFVLFSFPTETKDASARARWATKLKKRIQETQKPWVPSKFSRVCCEQVVDGFPSADHPELKLGYETKVAKKKRKASVVKNFNSKLTKASNDCQIKKSSDDASCSLVSTVDNSIASNDVPLTTIMERGDILHCQAMKKILLIVKAATLKKKQLKN